MSAAGRTWHRGRSAASFWLSRFVERQLFGVTAGDPATVAAAAFLIAFIGKAWLAERDASEGRAEIIESLIVRCLGRFDGRDHLRGILRKCGAHETHVNRNKRAILAAAFIVLTLELF